MFEPILYGQKPEGRMVALPSTAATRVVTTTTVAHLGQVKRSVTTTAVPQGVKGKKCMFIVLYLLPCQMTNASLLLIGSVEVFDYFGCITYLNFSV